MSILIILLTILIKLEHKQRFDEGYFQGVCDMHFYEVFLLRKELKNYSIDYTDSQTVRIVNKCKQIKDGYDASNK